MLGASPSKGSNLSSPEGEKGEEKAGEGVAEGSKETGIVLQLRHLDLPRQTGQGGNTERTRVLAPGPIGRDSNEQVVASGG